MRPWRKWSWTKSSGKGARREGYFWPEPLLDSAIQVFIRQLLECSNISAAPKAVNNLTLLRPPSGPRVTCLERMDKARAVYSEKGQYSGLLGEVVSGTLAMYDSDTGDLLAHIGDYRTFNFGDARGELKENKHFVSWRPKSVSPEILERIVSKALKPEALIAMLEKGERGGRACHIVEFGGERDSGQTFLARCLNHLETPSSQSEFWLFASDAERTQSHYEAFHHKDAALRFDGLPLENLGTSKWDQGLLRPGVADMIFLYEEDIKRPQKICGAFCIGSSFPPDWFWFPTPETKSGATLLLRSATGRFFAAPKTPPCFGAPQLGRNPRSSEARATGFAGP